MRNLVVAFGAIALASLALSIYALTRSAVRAESPHAASAAGRATTKPEAPKRTLAQAMEAAEARMPRWESWGSKWDSKKPLPDDERRTVSIELYRTLLSKGAPVAIGGRQAEITREFSEALTDDEREEWLADCLKFVKSTVNDSTPLRSLDSYTGKKHTHVRIGNVHPWGMLEAIFNLSTSTSTRFEAKAIWDAKAQEEYARDAANTESLRGQPGVYGLVEHRIKQIPTWP